MTGITLTGAYGGFNLGDEATLRAVTTLFGEGGGGIEDVIVFSRNANAILDEHTRSGLVFSDFANLLRTIPLVMRSNLLVGGGGFVQGRGLLWPFSYISLLIVANRLAGRRPVVLGIGADRPTHAISRCLFRHFFGLAAVITCRDAHTASVVEALGIPREKIRVTADFAFALKPPDVVRDRTPGQRLRALVVPGRDRKYMAPSTAAMQSVLRHLTAGAGAGPQVIVMPHDLRDDYDLGEIAGICAGIPRDRVTVVIPRTLSEALDLYRSADFVVSNRLHPLILAAVYGAVPVAAAHSTTKVRALVDALDLPSLGEPAGTSARLAMLDELTADRIASLRRALAPRVDAMRERARSNRDLARQAWGESPAG